MNFIVWELREAAEALREQASAARRNAEMASDEAKALDAEARHRTEAADALERQFGGAGSRPE